MRRYLIWSAVLLQFVLVAVASWVLYNRHRIARDAAEAVAELDRTEPGWRLKDVEAARAAVPEEELTAMTRAVEDVLIEIAADVAPRLLVLAKADQIDEERRAELAFRHPDAVLVSAATGEGVAGLVDRIETEFARRLAEVELLVPYGEGGRLAELHELAGDLEREDTPDGVRVLARLPANIAARYAPFALTHKPA